MTYPRVCRYRCHTRGYDIGYVGTDDGYDIGYVGTDDRVCRYRYQTYPIICTDIPLPIVAHKFCGPVALGLCDWDCEGIYDRIADRCVVGFAATLTLIISGAVLALGCFCVIGHNLRNSPENRSPEDGRFTLQSLVRVDNQNTVATFLSFGISSRTLFQFLLSF